MSDKGSLDEEYSAPSGSIEDEYLSDASGNPNALAAGPGGRTAHDSKWARLKHQYKDQYLQIFKDTFETGDEERLSLDLDASQLGAVTWEPREKALLYEALGRKGRHDLKALSRLIVTKSEVEVTAYLQWLAQAHMDRQRFAIDHKNISHGDIPGAIEIGVECEGVLNEAAAALSAFQEQYDFAAAQRNNRIWLIDRENAVQLDKKYDDPQTADPELGSESDDEENQERTEAFSFFHLPAFLDLSETFFMNQGIGDTWRNLAEPDERPAMTTDALTDLYDIVVNYVRRLVQTTLFIAKARLRSSTPSHTALVLIRHDDVSTALNVLNVRSNAQDFWIGLARRNKMFVVRKNWVKRFNPDDVIGYDEVETALSRRGRWRSLSVESEDMAEPSMSPAESIEEGIASAEDSGDDHTDSLVEDHDGPSSDNSFFEVEDAQQPDISSSSEEDGEVNETQPQDDPKVPLSKRKRMEMLEAEAETYMEQLDQASRAQEESRLLRLLDSLPEKTTKEEDMEYSPKRPRVMRKSVAETRCWNWNIAHQAEWEALSASCPSRQQEHLQADGSKDKT